jgi:hypothetical protein
MKQLVDKIKTDLTVQDGEMWTGFMWLGCWPLAGFCENDNERADLVQDG